jgi:protein-serine/threonine kinase
MNNSAAPAAGGPMPPPRTSSHRSSNAAGSRRDDTSRRTNEGTSTRPQQPGHSRSATAVGQPPIGTNLPREESTVINRIGVSDPKDDLAREQARQAERAPIASGADLTPITGLGLVGSEGVDDGGRGAGGKSRQDHSKSEGSTKRTKFGNYILGQTLGEGEFGKVKMGWKRDSSVEVAIKLIRRETLGSNSNRLQKIYREIHILRGLDHPNIVRLHEMVETERHIGIILEYASGGELFDYILNHRYLKDGPARKLFAQLISGVGYLHKKGIVHRDLKLENLLLDRNKNIIITDFGFANTFDPKDELSEEVEYRLGDKDFVRSMGLDQPDARRGDLMQTSCGSPCYAAPELVVSDSLYTGCKVDVWSCGVILYAMLAGYLPFDDDPANPEGDNINLLYKYIVSTPLTFPEYVTPHARDLLKRILVPDPRKRADLFEVARHSWLADYAHVVGFITTSNAAETQQQGSVYAKEPYEQPPPLARSASVREPAKQQAPSSAHGGLTAKRDQINHTAEKPKTSRENKRRTVQVEYVAPQSQTQRGEASPPIVSADATPKARPVDRMPVEPANTTTDGYQSSSSARPPRSSGAAAPPQSRPGGQPQRSVSDYTAFGTAPAATTRPATQGTMGSSRMPSRGNSYAQPAAATVAPTNAEGRFSQPKGKTYSISAPYSQEEPVGMGEPSIGQPSTQRVQSTQIGPTGGHHKGGHKRSNTVTETLGRMTSMFGGRQHSYTQDPKGSVTSQESFGRPDEERKQKRYPPTSMPAAMSNDNSIGSSGPRPSTDSRRRPSFSFSRKNTDDGSKGSRRFSLLPSSFSKTFGSQRESMPADGFAQRRGSNATRARNNSRSGMAFGRGAESRSPSQSTMGSSAVPGFYDGQHDSNSRIRHANASANSHATPGPSSAPPHQTQFDYPNQAPIGDDKFPNPQQPHPSQAPNRPYRHHGNESQTSEQMTPTQSHGSQPQRAQYPQGMGSDQEQRGGKLQKSRKFADAYEDSGANKGSSGSSKKVMDFFRQMGRRRAGK